MSYSSEIVEYRTVSSHWQDYVEAFDEVIARMLADGWKMIGFTVNEGDNWGPIFHAAMERRTVKPLDLTGVPEPVVSASFTPAGESAPQPVTLTPAQSAEAGLEPHIVTP